MIVLVPGSAPGVSRMDTHTPPPEYTPMNIQDEIQVAVDEDPIEERTTFRRTRTDWGYLKAYILACIGWIIVAIFAFTNGRNDPDQEIDLEGVQFEITAKLIAIISIPIISFCMFFLMMLKYFTAFTIGWSILTILVFFLICLGEILKNLGTLGPKVTLGLSFTLITITLVGIFVLYLFRKQIAVAIKLIKEAGRAIGDVKSTLVLPLFPVIFKGLIFLFSYYIFMFADNIEVTNMENGQRTTTRPGYVGLLQVYNMVMSIWMIYFIKGVYNLILASNFTYWYWTLEKNDIPYFIVIKSVIRTCRYHLGTAVVGSVLLTTTRLLHTLFKANESSVNIRMGFLNPIFYVFKCLPSNLVEASFKFLKYLNKNAYIMCAMRGTPFITSAKNALSLILRNILQVFVLSKVVKLAFFAVKLQIAMISFLCCYYFFGYSTSTIIIAAIVSTYAYIIASMFFEVYAFAIETLFLCFLEELELRQRSPNSPRFMSDQLMKIFIKKPRVDTEAAHDQAPTF